jgi:hypothetical protein
MDKQKGNIQFRFYKEKDEVYLVRLFNKIFEKNMSFAEWNWYYKDHPLVKSFINLAFCDTELAGSAAGVPFVFTTSSGDAKGIRIQHAMIEAEYRNRGLFKQMIQNISEQNVIPPFDFIFTFPTRDISLKCFLDLNYKTIDKLFPYFLDIKKTINVHNKDAGYSIQHEPLFDKADALFISDCLKQYTVFVKRDVDYLNWRYNRKSGKEYHVLRIAGNKGIEALVVYKIFEPSNTIDIIEYFARSNETDVVNTVINRLIAEHKKSIAGFNIWMAPHYSCYDNFINAGFERTDFVTNFVVKKISDESKVDYYNFENYYISYGDSDIY